MTHRLCAVLLLCSTVLAGGAWRQAGAAPDDPAPNSVRSVDYAFLGGGSIAVRIVFQHEFKDQPLVFATYHPATRIVLEFANTRSAVSREPVEVRQRGLWSLQTVRSGTRTRVIVTLLQPMVRETGLAGKELIVMLRRP